MRFSDYNGTKNKVTLIGTMLFIHAVLIYIIIYMMVSRSGTQCQDVFQRPFEQHQIRLRPKRPNFPLEQLESNDATKLVNFTEFQYINNNEIICANSEVFLLILISSAPGNKPKRDSIRKTWGDRGPDVKLLFMLGYSENKATEMEIEIESHIYMDIVQGNFIDSYKNLTYKSVMSLKYVVYHCPQTTYVLKVDDDSFVNTPLLMNFLKHDLSPYGAENLFLCNDMTGSPAIREPNSKWYMPVEDFPDDCYPSYCSGWYAIFSPDIAFKLYKASQKLKYIYIDDAFVYGIAAQKANVTHVDLSYYTLAYRNEELLFNGTYDNIPLLFGYPNMGPEQIERVHGYFKNRPVEKSIHKLLGQGG
ncbi:unnamed protein product [Ceutorhynchus assimilis]|uniref:Hexosyltransferase n=1 Tax=Ceutorhynchus assimilis TaxID=467358 RepID=A0A9N9MI36_9CUCU|nr:unnamed protein product [Ceutorhynchus assimilis]